MQEKDINQLYAAGNYAQIHSFIREVYKKLNNKVYISRHEDKCELCHLEFSFMSSGGFPKDIFREITNSLLNTDELYIRISSDEPCSEYLE